jgi:hypothetical protein
VVEDFVEILVQVDNFVEVVVAVLVVVVGFDIVVAD